MKKILLMGFALLPFIGRAQSGLCVVKLDIDTVKARKAYLIYAVGEKTVVDSPAVKDGKAEFRATIPYPVTAQLSLDNKGYGYANGLKPDLLRFYLEKGTIIIKTKQLVSQAAITGSKLNKELLQYYRFIQEPITLLEDANYAWMMATPERRKDTANERQFMATMRQGVARLKELQTEWVKAHPDAHCSLMAMQGVAGSNIDVAKVKPLYEGLSANVRNTPEGKALGERIEAAGKTKIGSMAPEFTQNDVNGRPLKLSDFRGKYVLLDFWASWCGPCRAENPNYVKAYNQYKDKNFTLLGVSLDQPGKKDAWLAAIKKDGLEWPQVSDLKYWNNEVAQMYDVKAVPANFLIDPNGKIIAKNLRGEELQKKLAEILGGMARHEQPDSSFTVKGYLAGEQQPKKIYLRYNQHVDSAVLDKGHFAFKGFVSKPVYAQLYCEEKTEPGQFNNNHVSFYLDPADVSVTSMRSLAGAVVQGGQTEAEQQVWNKIQEPLVEKRGRLMTRKYYNRDHEDSVIILTKEIAQVNAEINKLQVQFVTRFPDSYMSYEMMKGNAIAIDPTVLNPMLDALNPKFTNNAEVKDIIHRKQIAERTWIGQPALEFTQADVNGQPVSLASFRGKYVFVDFWASWCGWCRIENPTIIKAYNKYKGKGFDVLGVSLDDAKDKDKWLEAIKKDGVPWQQVCDLKGRDNEVAKLYGIKGIPQSVLVGPDGTIVAKNLRGDDLLVKLQELLGK